MPHITRYVPGDILTRIHEANNNRSFMGVPVFFLGIANNHIYFVGLSIQAEKGKIHKLSLDYYGEGWDRYTEPMTLFTEELLERLLNRIRYQNALDSAAQSQQQLETAQQMMNLLK